MLTRIKRKLRAGQLARRHEAIYTRYRNHTMVPKSQFAENLQLASLCSNVWGCVVECGVWRGGMSAAISEILGPDREYCLFDSFQGLPEAKPIDGGAAQEWQKNTFGPNYFDNCKAEQAFAEEAMRMAGIADAQIMAGWFKDTLPHFPANKRIALLRLDGDWFESTLECLEYLYPKVTHRGLIIIDDYYTWDGCARAVHHYLGKHGIADRIRSTPRGVCYLRKEDRGETPNAKPSAVA